MPKKTPPHPPLTLGQQAARYGLSLLLSLLFALLSLAAFYLLPARVAYRIEERYRFEAPGRLALGLLLPQDGPYQRVSAPQIAWEGVEAPQEESLEAPGLRVLHLQGRAEGAASITVAYQVELYQGARRWAGEPQPADLQPQPGVESDAPEIQALAREMPGAGREAAYSHYRYTARTLHWPASGADRVNEQASARAALASGEGVCADFSYLMAALNRAAGIPSRSISGLAFQPFSPPFLRQQATWGHPGGAHAWVEFYTDGEWAMADPSWAGRLLGPVYFGRSDGSHLSYGEAQAEARAYRELTNWVEAQGLQMGAAMSAPLKFVAAGENPGLSVTPEAAVTKTWDGRWLNLLLGFAVMIVVVRLADRRLLRRFAGRAGAGMGRSPTPQADFP